MSEQKSVRDPKKVKLMNAVVSLLGLAVTFALAYGFDKWAILLRRQARETFSSEFYYWFLSISTLLFACLMLALAWFVWFRAIKTRVVSMLYLVIGLLGTFAFPIEFSIHSSPSGLILTDFVLPNSRAVYVSAFAAAIGIAGLVLSKFNHD
jgi:hypothetical protein